jgi:pimeloyl-ACP methyl ester carboxylesterase
LNKIQRASRQLPPELGQQSIIKAVGINRYRNNDRDFAFLQGFKDKRIKQPALYIGGERDHVLTMFGNRPDLMKAALPDLRGMDILSGCGHWTQQERPREVNERLLKWLGSI